MTADEWECAALVHCQWRHHHGYDASIDLQAASRPASYRDVFAVREFRAVWSAQVLSLVGSQFAQVAIAILVYRRTHSAFFTGLAYSLIYLAPVVGGPIFALFADVLPRRAVMIACDLLRIPIVAAMAIPAVPFWVLCGLVVWTAMLGVPFSAARAAILPTVLDGDKFVLGSAIGNMTGQISQILGFVAGAGVVAAAGPYRTLLLDAASFGLSALLVAHGVRSRPVPASAPGPSGPAASRAALWRGARESARLVYRNRKLRLLVLLGWLAGIYMLPEALAAPYAHALRGGPLVVGLLMAAMPAGTTISAICLFRLVRPPVRLRILGWLAMATCAPLMGSAFRPPLAVVLMLWILSGIGNGYQIAAASAFMRNLPDASRGFIFGLVQSCLLAAQGLGFIIGGAAAQAIGPEAVVALAGALGLAAATPLAVSWKRVQGNVSSPTLARPEVT